ncbi:MAG: NlpC/P60 family protein [Parvibaculales bacterium]
MVNAKKRVYLTHALAPLYGKAEGGALETQMLYGEGFVVERAEGGMLFGEAVFDGYRGFVPEGLFSAERKKPTHYVCEPLAHLYSEGDVKAAVLHILPMGARVFVEKEAGDFVKTEKGFLYKEHIAAIGDYGSDFVVFAERFLNVPYLWGGRSFLGIDCSALLQLALQMVGVCFPRNSSDQQKMAGEPIGSQARRGDIIFWEGHIGIFTDGESIIHANAYHMKVVCEAVSATMKRINAPYAVYRL